MQTEVVNFIDKLSTGFSVAALGVFVYLLVFCSPVNDQERKARSPMCVDMHESRRAVTVKSHHDKTFTFDGIFGKDSSQIDVYKTVVQPLISEVLQGYNCTVFA